MVHKISNTFLRCLNVVKEGIFQFGRLELHKGKKSIMTLKEINEISEKI